MWWQYLLVLLGIIFLLWWALTRQASFTETPAEHGHHEEHEHAVSDAHIVEAVPVRVEEAVVVIEPEPIAPVAAAVPVEEIAAPAVPVTPDDLEIIEGIGPKIGSVLKEAGVLTFAQLAGTEQAKIKEILEAADPRLARISDPTSWPLQAKLAAAGDQEGLQKLQDSLKGGRSAA